MLFGPLFGQSFRSRGPAAAATAVFLLHTHPMMAVSTPFHKRENGACHVKIMHSWRKDHPALSPISGGGGGKFGTESNFDNNIRTWCQLKQNEICCCCCWLCSTPKMCSLFVCWLVSPRCRRPRAKIRTGLGLDQSFSKFNCLSFAAQLLH